jgi:hypothetical protein
MKIEDAFPNLAHTGYRITSPDSTVYNCIAWAAAADQHWWEPADGPGYYWPASAAREYSVAALIQVYESLGYSPCADASLEPGFEKVALYGNDQGYTHAARQLDTGTWTSKMGPLEDIEHNTLDALEGEEYGAVVKLLKRAISTDRGLPGEE